VVLTALDIVNAVQPSGVDMVEIFDADQGTAQPPPGFDADLLAPDFETVFLAPEAGAQMGFRGAEGFGEGWRDWLEPWSSYVVDVEDTRLAGEQVVSLVRIRARSRRDGVEVEHEAAAIWTLRDGLVTRVEFHLDREQALRSVGVEPGA
jgi:ketosteroid isomerase-like protein